MSLFSVFGAFLTADVMVCIIYDMVYVCGALCGADYAVLARVSLFARKSSLGGAAVVCNVIFLAWAIVLITAVCVRLTNCGARE